jgi:uncharacterized protein (TIGR01244 family)
MRRRESLASLLAVIAFMPDAYAADQVPQLAGFHAYSPILAISGQPRRDQFSAIAKAGFKVVVNVGAPESNPQAIRDEQRLVEAEGMQYHYIPLSWETPDKAQVKKAVALLQELQGQPSLVHCYVGSRAALVAYLQRSAASPTNEAQENATMSMIWRQHRGYELENSRQWQLLLADIRSDSKN